MTIDTEPVVGTAIGEYVVTAAALAHSNRFRKVCTGYPRAVALAYGRDIVRAAADSDELVAATVADWERREGVPVRDWQALGRDERDEAQL